MALEQILQALEGQTERQIAEIERATNEQIAEIQVEAHLEAKRIYQKELDAIQTQLQFEQARILNRAKLEALQISLRAREQIMQSALEAGSQHLARFRAGAGYPNLLAHLAREAMAALESDSGLQFSVQPCDVELMKAIAEELGIQALVKGDLVEESAPLYSALFEKRSLGSPIEQTENSAAQSNRSRSGQNDGLGGLIVMTQNGHIRLKNTLTIRLRMVAELYRAQVAEIVYGDGQEV